MHEYLISISRVPRPLQAPLPSPLEWRGSRPELAVLGHLAQVVEELEEIVEELEEIVEELEKIVEELEGELTFLVLSELQLLQWKQPLQFLLFMNLHSGHLSSCEVEDSSASV